MVQGGQAFAGGDIVVIKEDNLLSAQWPLARVTEICPGEDSLV